MSDALFPDLITHKFGSSVKLKESLLVEGSDTKILKRRVKINPEIIYFPSKNPEKICKSLSYFIRLEKKSAFSISCYKPTN